MVVSSTEVIARAICADAWDGERYSASLFKGSQTSVSRLSITPLEDTWDLFRCKVEKPPTRTLQQIGTIGVGRLQQLGSNHLKPTTITVEPDPLPDYDSHAIIPQNISRGLANRIIDALQIHHDMGC